MPSRLNLSDIQETAKLKGGKCLSKEYINSSLPLKWMCEKGHTWDASYSIISQGGWCVQCDRRLSKETYFDEVKKIANSKGGRCLSKEFIDSVTKLRWQCKEGHVWEASPSAIRAIGSWCPVCSYASRRIPLEVLKAKAKARGGDCLTKEYKTGNQNHTWICREGHQWKATAGSVMRGQWCRTCGYIANGLNRRLPYKIYVSIAAKKGGRVITPESKYINSQEHIEFECRNHHTWSAAPVSIKAGSWCPHCAGKMITLMDLKSFASEKGGKCISREYQGSSNDHEWKCSKGHTWFAKFSHLRAGKWCPLCKREEEERKNLRYWNAIAEKKKEKKQLETDAMTRHMHQIAAKKNGRCLSPVYEKAKKPMVWQCAEGHQWKATLYSIEKKDSWCVQCNMQKVRDDQMERLKKLALSRGGEVLSGQYIDQFSRLTFRCSEGHTWSTKANLIIGGMWCPECAVVRKRLTIAAIRKFARSKGGKCISDRYKNSSSIMKWQCAKGHIWKAVASLVLYNNSWCPVCAPHQRVTLLTLREHARNLGGKCLSTAYNVSEKQKWECAKGHIWFSKFERGKSKKWCPACHHAKPRIPFSFYADLAKERKGKLLTHEKDFVNCTTPMKWQCKLGHIWKSKPTNVYHAGSWCPNCAKQKRTIADMQKFAKQQGGKCITEVYQSGSTPLEWECKKGHRWMAAPKNISRVKWCPVCSGRIRTIDDMKELAREKKGKCISKIYINSTTKLKWECHKGHQWMTTPEAIKNERWCPQCAGLNKTIADMQEIAKKHKGKCLSKKYINGSTELIWECRHGHQWMAKPNNIIRKFWCRECHGAVSRVNPGII
jgi:hypothetical protein